MSEDKLQPDLQDYLDDRLDAEQRRRFEVRLAHDETLARRVALALETRKAMRHPEEELSEAFYTRTVARFAAGRRRSPFGLSWSTAGLAVATIAAAVLFVPGILRKEIAVPATTQTQSEVSPLAEGSLQKNNGRAESFDESDVADADRASADAKESNVANKIQSSVVGSDAPTDPEFEGLERRVGSREASNEPVPPPAELQAPKPQRPPGKQENASPVIADELSPVHPRLQSGALQEKAQEQAKGSLDDIENIEVGESDEGVYRRARADASFKFGDVSLSSVFEIADDLVGVGEIELLDMRDAERDLVSSLKKKDARAPIEDRLVAIGRRPGLEACAALTVRRTEKAWEIDYEDSGSSIGTVSCGVNLPSDGVEIRFQGWSVDE